jgi:hypothetical protein
VARARERSCFAIRAVEQNHHEGIGFYFRAEARQIEHEQEHEHDFPPPTLTELLGQRLDYFCQHFNELFREAEL